MGQLVVSDAFDSSIDTNVWSQDVDSQGGSNWAQSVIGSLMTFQHDGGTTMASSFLARTTAMEGADYAVKVTARLVGSDQGVVLIGLRCVGPGATDADREGMYAAINFGETGIPEGSSGAWVDDRASLYHIPGDFKWDDADRVALNPGEGTVPSDSDNLFADLTTPSHTFIEFVFSVSGSTYALWANGALIFRAKDTSLTSAGFARVGCQSDEAAALVNMDDVEIFLAGPSGASVPAAQYAHAGYDESRNEFIVSVPTAGADTPQQFVYDITHDEWYKRDQSIRSFGQALDVSGEQHLVFGDSSGFVNVFNETTTWTDDATAFTGTWQSNWLDMGDKQKRKLFERLVVDLAKSSSNTSFAVTLEVTDHPDGYTQKCVGTVHTINLRTAIMTRLGGRYVRIKVVHSAAGTLEIHRITAELAGARSDSVEAR